MLQESAGDLQADFCLDAMHKGGSLRHKNGKRTRILSLARDHTAQLIHLRHVNTSQCLLHGLVCVVSLSLSPAMFISLSLCCQNIRCTGAAVMDSLGSLPPGSNGRSSQLALEKELVQWLPHIATL